MILKGSQRANASELAAHLLNDRDNDHVRVHELRGFVAGGLAGALAESEAIAKGTRCTQHLFSLSLNPPKDAAATERDFEAAADEAEKRLGLAGQPRAIVIHEKEGRRHAHVVWSRINAETMRAINLPHFKLKLRDLARDLFLDHGWSLPDGLRTNGGKSPLNFTLAEWQQAKRHGLDPREIKDAIQSAWARCDDLRSLGHALTERGYFIAQGDRRGFVVLDTNGEVYSLARWVGVKTKELRVKLGEPDHLPSVEAVQHDIARRMSGKLSDLLMDARAQDTREFAPLRERQAQMRQHHRAERATLHDKQESRWRVESQRRAARFRTGLLGLWDSLTGKAASLRRDNEAEMMDAVRRDRAQRDRLVIVQMDERQALQRAIDGLRKRHAHNHQLLMSDAAAFMRRADRQPIADASASAARDRMNPPSRNRTRGHSPDL